MNKKEQAFLDSLTPMENVSPYAKILVYGEAGVGKTVLACTMGTRILYVDSAEGWVSLRNHPNLKSKCIRAEYQGLSQLETIASMIVNGNLDVDTIVLDEASTMAVLDLDIVLASRSAKDASKDPNVPTQPDFFANTERCRRTFINLLKLPVHVVMTAHERQDKDEVSGRIYTRPAFSPKLRASVEQNVHLIAYMTAIEKGDKFVRRIQTQPARNITAKSRIGGLKRVEDDPNLNDLLQDFILQPEDEQPEMVKEPDAPVTESTIESDEFTFGE